jgi:hypothetical protein
MGPVLLARWKKGFLDQVIEILLVELMPENINRAIEELELIVRVNTYTSQSILKSIHLVRLIQILGHNFIERSILHFDQFHWDSYKK